MLKFMYEGCNLYILWRENILQFTIISINQGFESRWMSVELMCYVKKITVYRFYDFFCRRHSLMNRPYYNNSFQFMQHDNFRNLNRAIFTHWKHLEFRINAFWYCFPVIKRYTFQYLMKLAPIPGNQSSFEILLLFDIMALPKFSDIFSSFVILI